MISFQCPQCGQAMQAEEQYAGMATQCPACQAAAQIPGPAGGPPPMAYPPPTPTSSGGNGLKVGIIIGVCVLGGLAFIALLIAILLPPLGQAREAARRAQCLSNLRGFGNVLKIYASNNNDQFPCAMPHTDASGNTLMDSQEAMWLMVQSMVATPDSFICPTDRQEHDVMAFDDDPSDPSMRPFPDVDGAGRVGGSNRTWSYSYQISNGQYGDPGRDNPKATRFAIMADRAPGLDRILLPPYAQAGDLMDAQDWLVDLDDDEKARVNSPNHAGQGQNVLFQDGHAQWSGDPWVGINGDNIYTWGDYATAMQSTPWGGNRTAAGGTLEQRIAGQLADYVDPITLGPASDDDSVLVNVLHGEAVRAP